MTVFPKVSSLVPSTPGLRLPTTEALRRKNVTTSPVSRPFKADATGACQVPTSGQFEWGRNKGFYTILGQPEKGNVC